MRGMHPLALLPLALLLALAGCETATLAVGATEMASVAVLGRGVVDVGVSAITGKDCSIVRLDQVQSYCAPRERLPGPPPFCTNTLGTVQCWANPEAFAILPRQLADAPGPTPEQVRNINARWPKSLNIGN